MPLGYEQYTLLSVVLSRKRGRLELRPYVRFNAFKHRVFSKQVVISSKAIGKDPKEFESLLERLWDHYQPADIAEELQVELKRKSASAAPLPIRSSGLNKPIVNPNPLLRLAICFRASAHALCQNCKILLVEANAIL